MVKEEGARKAAEDAVPTAPGQSRTKNVAWLTTLAKQAFEQKRSHNCLALTRAILLIEPDNAAALSMQAAIQSGEEPSPARETAPITVPQPEPIVYEPESALSFTASPVPAPLESFATGRRKTWPWAAIGVTVTAGILIFLLTSWLAHRQPSATPVADAAPHPTASTSSQSAPQAANSTSSQAPGATAPDPLPTQPAASATESASTSRTKPPQDLASREAKTSPAATAKPAVPAAIGTLTITSSLSAEIYEGNRRLGATPASLQLSPGAHQIEYRHEDLRKTVSYVIRTNETTTAAISFDVTVPINARPWAQVFLDDGQRKALGQTPLSGVQVPVGGVLVFENPNFPGKTYRVTGKESAIQITFP